MYVQGNVYVNVSAHLQVRKAMKNKKVAFWLSILIGVFIFAFISTARATEQYSTHESNLDPNPHAKYTMDYWQGYLDTTALSFAVHDSWRGGTWDLFGIHYETASDTWLELESDSWTYTDLIYDARSRPDTLQATLYGAATAGGEFIVIGYDYDGI